MTTQDGAGAAPRSPKGAEASWPREASGPLKGIKVIEIGTFVAAPYAATMMGAMGADVIKVEALEGDPARMVGPFFVGEGRAFQGWNPNKRSLAVDLRSEAGREIIHDLVRGADVLIENFRPGTTEKLKLDYATLQKLNHGLIYCASTAFGDKGPYRRRGAYDAVLQALGGVCNANARFAGKETLTTVLVADFHTAMMNLSAINAALFHRERTGEGQLISTSLLQSVMSIQAASFAQAVDVEAEGPIGSFPYGLFKTKDGLICITCLTNLMWENLCDAIGGRELAEHPDYQSNPDRGDHKVELTEKLEAYLAKKTTSEWEVLLTEAKVPCGAVKTALEFFDDPQVEAMEMNPVVEHSKIGPIRLGGVPFNFGKTPGAIQRAAPVLGEHTGAILEEIGYDTARIEELKVQGVIAQSETVVSQ